MRHPAFRLSEALLACGLPRERLLDEVTRSGELGSDVIDLGLCEGQKNFRDHQAQKNFLNKLK